VWCGHTHTHTRSFGTPKETISGRDHTRRLEVYLVFFMPFLQVIGAWNYLQT